MNTKLEWFNFRTEEYDLLGGFPDGHDPHDYIPQINAAQSLFDLYIETGLSILEATQKTLEACAGVRST